MNKKRVVSKERQKNSRSRLGLNARKTKGYIDSFNVSYSGILTLFQRKSDRYIVQRIDTKNRAHQAKWYKLFGKSIFNKTTRGTVCPFHELYVVECPNLDIVLPLKVSVANKRSFTLEFAGLRKYNNKSERLQALLWDLLDDMQDFRINRIDVAIDLRHRIPNKVYQSLARVGRYPKKYKNTTYFKTIREKKRNSIVNILIYDKGIKEGFVSENKTVRLEYQFSARFFKNLRVKDIAQAVLKIEKRISKDTGLNVQVCDDYRL